MGRRSCFRTFAGSVVTSAAAACFVIALASPAWLTGSGYEYGLWKVCDGSGSNCQAISLDLKCQVGGFDQPFSKDCAKFGAIRAMAILAVVFGCIAALFQVVVVAIFDRTSQRGFATLLGFLAFLSGLAAMAIAVSMNNDHALPGNWGYAFALETLGWLMMIFGTAYFWYESENVG